MDEPAAPDRTPFDRVVGPWDDVLDDMAATAAEYRADDWQTIELHPGDVETVTGEHADDETPLGFDVVVPGDEFERLRDALADRTVDRYEVFAATGNAMVFLLVAVESDDLAVLFPLYYDQSDQQGLVAAADEDGLTTRLRPLVDEESVTISHHDPDPFFPA